jgi:hypothetical protein
MIAIMEKCILDLNFCMFRVIAFRETVEKMVRAYIPCYNNGVESIVQSKCRLRLHYVPIPVPIPVQSSHLYPPYVHSAINTILTRYSGPHICKLTVILSFSYFFKDFCHLTSGTNSTDTLRLQSFVIK